MSNHLYYGDNLPILHNHIADDSVDLIYLDPPFNSNATYNVLFKERDGSRSRAQITAFEDTWHWGLESELVYNEVVTDGPPKLGQLLEALRMCLGTNDMMAYLTMMAPRLAELHRVLKPTGSLYLHCDPTASHYLKILIDSVFQPKRFRNEICWCYRKWSVKAGQFVRNHDVLLFYSKTEQHIFNPQYVDISPGTMKRWKGKKQQAVFEDGVRKAQSNENEEAKSPCPDWWELSILNSNSAERLGYPTQKPETLLDRIIRASSNEGDVVLDPFCGCGTAISVAERLGRQWIGIDITHLAVALMKHRMTQAFGAALSPYTVHGEPEDLASAKTLAEHDRYQFEWWALGLIGARPAQDKKKGADSGIDGVVKFFDDTTNKPKTIVVQVKSGKVQARDVRDLKGVLEREKAAIGVLITLQPPTKPMQQEAAAAGFYEPAYAPQLRYPRLQLLTIEGLLSGTGGLAYPASAPTATLPRTPKRTKHGEQPILPGFS